jgi:hypothetical protein
VTLLTGFSIIKFDWSAEIVLGKFSTLTQRFSGAKFSITLRLVLEKDFFDVYSLLVMFVIPGHLA